LDPDAFFSPGFDLALLGLDADASLVCGLDVPLATLGVEDVLSLILGFFTESGRWGV
jgi:hypothetical protein